MDTKLQNTVAQTTETNEPKPEQDELLDLMRKLDNCKCHCNFIADRVDKSRELSLVLTKIDEAFMWAERRMDSLEVK
jgi:hypothetical protein